MRTRLNCAIVILSAMFFASYAYAADGKQICDEVYRILHNKEPDTGERTPEIIRARDEGCPANAAMQDFSQGPFSC